MNTRDLFGCCLLLSVPHATAGPHEDGVAAYDQRQFATALKLWQPLAEQGNAAAQFNVAVLYQKGLGTACLRQQGWPALSLTGMEASTAPLNANGFRSRGWT